MSKCPKCNDTGMADSGGVQPWGEPILIGCDCVVEEVKMTSREQFEQQCRNGLVNGGLAVFENGVYVSELTRAVWSGWQASRAAIELELPSKYYSDAYFGNGCCDDYANNILDKVYLKIESAGLKVKK